MLKVICILEFADDTTNADIDELGEALDKFKYMFSDVKLCRTNVVGDEDVKMRNKEL